MINLNYVGYIKDKKKETIMENKTLEWEQLVPEWDEIGRLIKELVNLDVEIYNIYQYFTKHTITDENKCPQITFEKFSQIVIGISLRKEHNTFMAFDDACQFLQKWCEKINNKLKSNLSLVLIKEIIGNHLDIFLFSVAIKNKNIFSSL